MCKCALALGHEMHLQPEQESILGQFLHGGLDLEVYLDGLLRATTKEGRQLFWQKSAPPDIILATPMLLCIVAY